MGTKATSRSDTDLIPDVAKRSEEGNHHTGRGGAGNELVGTPKEEPAKPSSPVGLADKLKAKLFGKKRGTL